MMSKYSLDELRLPETECTWLFECLKFLVWVLNCVIDYQDSIIGYRQRDFRKALKRHETLQKYNCVIDYQ